MINKDLERQWTMTYYEQLVYLKEKYGRVPKNYFCNQMCKSKSSGITRTADGLFIHHDYEYNPDDDRVCDLSKSLNAKLWPWKYQLAENLTYCNWLEHLMLHIKINILRFKQLGFYVNDGVVNYFAPDLNKFYTYQADPTHTPTWQLTCFTAVEDYYEDYCFMMSEWCKAINWPDYNWKKL